MNDENGYRNGAENAERPLQYNCTAYHCLQITFVILHLASSVCIYKYTFQSCTCSWQDTGPIILFSYTNN